jgi:hypothetical protein
VVTLVGKSWALCLPVSWWFSGVGTLIGSAVVMIAVWLCGILLAETSDERRNIESQKRLNNCIAQVNACNSQCEEFSNRIDEIEAESIGIDKGLNNLTRNKKVKADPM